MGAKRGRPKKKVQGKKNPFDLGLNKGKIFDKIVKKGSLKVISYGQKLNKELLTPLQSSEDKLDDIKLKEVEQIVECAEQIGLGIQGNKEEAIRAMVVQLKQGEL